MFKSMVVVSAGLALVAGCGGGKDSESAADSPLVQALSSEIYAESASGVSTEAEASCVAEAVVSGIGEERLQSLGMSADNVGDIGQYEFTDDEIGVIVDSLLGCVDVKAALAQEMTSQFGGEGAECVAENLDDDFVRNMMSVALKDPNADMPDEFFQTFLDIAAECDLPMN